MDSDKAKVFLWKIIDKTKKWENDNFLGEMNNVKLRSYKCKVKPTKIIHEKKRKGKDGLRLCLSCQNEMDEPFESEIEVHIIPERKGCPAISIWRVDPETGKTGKNIRWIKITNKYFEAYRMDEMSIQDFYRHCTEQVTLKDKYSSKLFKNQISTAVY